MEPTDSEKPGFSVPIRKRTGKSGKGKRKAKGSGKGKHGSSEGARSIIKSSDERAAVEHSKQERAQRAEDFTGDGKAPLFQRVARRASSPVSMGIRQRHRRRRASQSGIAHRLRLLRFYWKSARREIRRFHARFTPKQIIGFYLGVPAAVSLLLCISFILMKPPRGVTPETVSRRRPAITELIQQIQADLQGHDPRAALSVVAELEKDYGEARKSYLHALVMVKGLVPALMNLGEVEFATGNYCLAAGYFEQAGERLPRNPLIMFRRYLCYSLLNERAKTESVKKELATRPDSVEWYFVQASEALHAGKRSEAQRLITAAGTLFGEQAAAYQESLRKIGWLK